MITNTLFLQVSSVSARTDDPNLPQCSLLWGGRAEALRSNLIKPQSSVTLCVDAQLWYRIYSDVMLRIVVSFVSGAGVSYSKCPRPGRCWQRHQRRLTEHSMWFPQRFSSIQPWISHWGFLIITQCVPFISQVFDMGEEEHDIILQKVKESKVIVNECDSDATHTHFGSEELQYSTSALLGHTERGCWYFAVSYWLGCLKHEEARKRLVTGI